MNLKQRSLGVLLLCLIVLRLAQGQGEQYRELPSAVSHLITELPVGSVLSQKLQAGQYGSGVEQVYMAKMRKLNVKRALFEVRGVWRNNNLEDSRIVRRLYFGKYDGPSAQIVDRQRLMELRAGGLEALLDQAALGQAKAGHFVALKAPEPSQVYSVQEFFDNPWLPDLRTPVSQLGKSAASPLLLAASEGDVLTVMTQLQHLRPSPKELNGPLFLAVTYRYENSSVIEALVRAGADVNARGYEDKTPLMMAINSPLNIQVLLHIGVRVNDRDSYGNTALKLAKEGHQLQSAELLEQAGGCE